MHGRGAGGGERPRCAHAARVRAREQVTGQGSVSVCMREEGNERARERERERETALMIDARLPPLCSIEWLQQKAQNNIHDSALGFSSPPPPASLLLRLCLQTKPPHIALQRLCRDGAGDRNGVFGINKLGFKGPEAMKRGTLDLQLSN